VLVLSQYVEPSYAMRLLEENPERAGYLLKDRVADPATLVDAIRRLTEARPSSIPPSSRDCSGAAARPTDTNRRVLAALVFLRSAGGATA
jgi:hypothetical protein